MNRNYFCSVILFKKLEHVINIMLKGEYEDYTWGYGQNLFREIQFQLVPLIPHSAITKTVLIRSRIFCIFTRVENQPLKQRLNQTRRIILK